MDSDRDHERGYNSASLTYDVRQKRGSSNVGHHMTGGWVDAYNWYTSIELVSLDFVRPVFSELGLGGCTTGEKVVREAARESLTELARTDSCDVELFYSQHVPQFLATLARDIGADCECHLKNWVSSTVCTESRNPWVYLEERITSWASKFRRAGDDGIGFQNPRVVLTQLTSERELNSVTERLLAQRRTPLSEWDQPLFVRRGMLEIPDDSEFYPWIDEIELVIGMARFHRFWSWLIANTGDQERIHLKSFLLADEPTGHAGWIADLFG